MSTTKKHKIDLITELVEDCKLVIEKSELDGHDCWGNREFTTNKYVMIKGKLEKCWDGWYIIHDGKKVSTFLPEDLISSKTKKEIAQRKKDKQLLETRIKKINKIKQNYKKQ